MEQHHTDVAKHDVGRHIDLGFQFTQLVSRWIRAVEDLRWRDRCIRFHSKLA